MVRSCCKPIGQSVVMRADLTRTARAVRVIVRYRIYRNAGLKTGVSVFRCDKEYGWCDFSVMTAQFQN
jgi:hypothetical protein